MADDDVNYLTGHITALHFDEMEGEEEDRFIANLKRVARLRLAHKMADSNISFVLWGPDALVYAFGAQEIPTQACHFLVPDDRVDATVSFLKDELSYELFEQPFGYLRDLHSFDSAQSPFFPRALCLSKPQTDRSYLDTNVPFDPMNDAMFEALEVVLHPASSFAFDISDTTRIQPLSLYPEEAGICVPTLPALLDSIAAVIHEPLDGYFNLRRDILFDIWLEGLLYHAPSMRRDDNEATLTSSQEEIMKSLGKQNRPWFLRLVTDKMMEWMDAVQERRKILLSMGCAEEANRPLPISFREPPLEQCGPESGGPHDHQVSLL